MREARALLAAAIGLALVARAGLATAADEPPPAPAARPMTEDELVAHALAHNPDLKVADVDRKIADARRIGAEALSNPTLRVEWLHVNHEPEKMGWGAGLGWNPPQPGVWSAEKAAARAQVASVEWDLRERRAELELAVRAHCADADSLAERIAIARASVAARERIVQALEARVAQGASTRVEASTAALSVARADQQRAALEAERAGVLQRLAALAALPPGAGLEVASRPRPERPIAAARPAEQRAIVKADDARIEASDRAVEAERARRWPWIGLASVPRYRYNESSGYQHDLSFAVDVTLPILDANRGRVAGAEAEREKNVELRAAHVAGVKNAVAIATGEVTRRRALVDRYKATLEPMLAAHVALLKAALDGGQVDVTALLAAEDMVLRARDELATATLAARRAEIDLARAVGELGGGGR